LVVVRFVKADGLPVRLVKEGDQDVAAIREVDLQKKYHRSATDLAEAVNLTLPKSGALRRHLGIDTDPACVHTFTFKSQKLTYFSDNAFTRMRDALHEGIDMDAIWASHGAGKRASPRPPCAQAGCKSRAAAS
jgi:diadenosine tetraphosphatase ApaH/serine/threonine PP2A family protein phosphatase